MSNNITTTEVNITLPTEIANIIQYAINIKKSIIIPSCSDPIAKKDVIECANNLITSLLCVANCCFCDYLNQLVKPINGEE